MRSSIGELRTSGCPLSVPFPPFPPFPPLMKDSVNKTYRFLRMLFERIEGGELILRLDERDLVPWWDDPE